jgi:cyclopropane fatty-acyl-phospholipid synthase-like methyltransferase
VKEKSVISGVNNYDYQLSQEEISRKAHRGKVGGFWEKLGQLQLDFMVEQGLRPDHRLLDIGCGCLRGGVKFIPYLDKSNYYGIDINESLLEAAKFEIDLGQLADKNPNLLLNNAFEFDKFATKFDFMISISLFTHLPMNIILRCLKRVAENLTVEGKYYSTFFISDKTLALEPVVHEPGNITTHYDRDPFHYAFEDISAMAKQCGLSATLLGEWNHPRAQQMVMFAKK